MKRYIYLFILAAPLPLSAQLYTPTTGGTTGNNNVGIVTSNAQAQLVVGDEFGAMVSGSGGGYGIFGSNFAIYQGGTNSNKLYTPYNHSSFGYAGMRTSWGKIDFFTSAGATTAGQIITPASRMTINTYGNVGIGTNNPDNTLTIDGQLGFFRNGSTPTNTSVGFIRYDDAFIIGNSSVVNPLIFQTNSTDRFLIDNNGNVGIGTTDPKGYRLAVAGKTITEEVVVKLQTNWPDYVFEKDYHLPSLSRLEQFIKTNKHLPDVPTAEEVKENGLSVGAMNAILLKKVEELTLHLIEQNKLIARLKEECTVSPDTSGKKVEALTHHLIELEKEVKELKRKVNDQ